MHITLDTYPNAGGCVVHLADHEIEEILEDLDDNTASGECLRRHLDHWMKGGYAQS